MTNQTLTQFSNEMAKSPSRERELFENFLAEYLATSPSEAFQQLYSSSANGRTRLFAEQFNDAVVERFFENTAEQISGAKQSSKMKEAAVLQKFFAEYAETKDFKVALEHAQAEINNDPDLRQDLGFQKRFQKIAEDVRPKQQKTKETKLQEDETVFVKVNQGLPETKDIRINDARLKQLVTDTLDKFYSEFLPATDKRRQQAQLETEAILTRRQIPIALVIAGKDAKKISEGVVAELRRLERNEEQSRDLAQQGVAFKLDWAAVLDTAKSLRQPRQVYTATEKIDIVRNLLMNLNGPLNAVQVKHAIDRAQHVNDEKLQGVLKQYQVKLEKAPTAEDRFELLRDTYKLYWDQDVNKYQADIKAEVNNLEKGFAMAGVELALKEIQEKDRHRLDAEALNKAVLRMTRGEEHDVQQGQKREALATAVTNILEDRNLQPRAGGPTFQPPAAPNQLKDLSLPKN